MCGIVGLFLKDPSLEPQLGSLTEAMLATLSDRGPDSAGFAVFGEGRSGETKITLRAASPDAAKELADRIGRAFSDAEIMLYDTHAVIGVSDVLAGQFDEWLAREAPTVEVVGRGKRMTLFKEVGRPEKVAERFGLGAMHGTHAIGHTRMATESAVTTDGAHPYLDRLRSVSSAQRLAVEPQQSPSHSQARGTVVRDRERYRGRRRLSHLAHARGTFAWRCAEGKPRRPGRLLHVRGRHRERVRRAARRIACKPAVMAETDRYVAFGSEYRALASLPGIEHARVWEPEPATVYFWER